MKLNQIPNIISVIRILLVAPVVYGLLNQQYQMAWWLFVIAGVSDGVDGYLARRFNWQTELGATLDPIGDKLLMVFSYLTLGWLAQLPVWLVALVILRDVVIVSGTLFYRRLTGDKEIQPLYISKVNTVVQILLVVVVIYSLAFQVLPTWLSQSLVYMVAVTTVTSGAGYVYVWTRRARKTILALLEKVDVHSLSHITGGGLLENLPRVMPENTKAVIQRSSWTQPAVFDWLQEQGNIETTEMYRTFNCGIGMVAVVDEADVDSTIATLKEQGVEASQIGVIESSDTTNPEVTILD